MPGRDKKPAARASSGRTTPKGASRPTKTPPPSARYTPPVPRSKKVSPPWYPFLILGLLVLGAVVIIINYVPVHFLPGEPSNWYLLLGLGLITTGFLVATSYR